MHGRPGQRGGQRHDTEAERERSANACHVLAGVAQSLGEALGPCNDHSKHMLEWASQLQSHVHDLRNPQEAPGAPGELRLVR